MHTIRTAKPGIATERYVQRYVQRHYVQSTIQNTVRLGDCLIDGFLVQPVPARLEQVISFQFGDPCLVRRPGGVVRAPGLSIAGAQTAGSASLLLQGNMDAFYVFLRPAALQALFGIPMVKLANRSCEARALLSAAVEELHEQLAEAPSFERRVEIAEQFLARCGTHAAPQPLERIMARILSLDGVVSMQRLADEATLSTRQLNRLFQAQVGMPPKVFARIARFQAALRYKSARPEVTWAGTAQMLHYHDQMHLVRDFRKLSGETPGGLLERLAFLNEDQRGQASRSTSDFYYSSAAGRA